MDYKEFSDSELFSLVCESSEDAKSLLFQKYKYVIDVNVKKFAYSALKLGIEYSDLYQEAYVGFIDAINHYDEEKNAKFSTFLSLCVSRRIQNAISKEGRMKNKIFLESLSLDQVYDQYQAPLRDVISDQNSHDPLKGITEQEAFLEFDHKVKKVLSSMEYEVYELLKRGISYIRIAQILDKSPKQIDNTIQRLKNKVKQFVLKEGL